MSKNKLVLQHNYLCTLLDYYGELLTSRRQQILNMSLENDMSLSEIAESLKISRQAVHDNIQQAKEQLEQYEIVLGMVNKDKVLIEKLDQIIKENMNSKIKLEKKSDIEFQLQELKEIICS